jgi:hypothetical protein|tara:strand:+ start:1450 stop:1974 length:525 start_codon:yes stop_codon:yes gene_type:complete
MATFDMTASSTAGVNSDSIAVLPASRDGMNMRMVEAILDISKITDYSCTNGDIFQLLEIPANTFVLFAGAEVLTAFDGSSPTVDIDFAAGDDIIDGGDVSSAGFLAEGSNGQANDTMTGAASTFTQFVTTTDTIDVKLIASSADVTTGKLRVYACVVDVNGAQELAAEVARDNA